MRNLTVYPRKEYEYLLADLVPIAFCFTLGTVVLVVTWIAECCQLCTGSNCACCATDAPCNKCIGCCTDDVRKFGKFLLHSLYEGKKFIKSEELPQPEEERRALVVVNNEIPSDKCWVHCTLASNAIIFITLLCMIFFDRYIVTSEFGCVVGKDCYVLNDDIFDNPIKNCTQYENSNTVCNIYSLEFLSALGDVGGLTFITGLLIVLTTKLIICCLKTCCRSKGLGCCCMSEGDEPCCRSKGLGCCCMSEGDEPCCRSKGLGCCCYIIQVFIVLIATVLYVTVIVVVHTLVVQNNTPLRLTGYILRYIAVYLTFSITTLIPWHCVVHND